MTAPRVAVCTPVYNGGAYLAETLACVQAQDYPNLVHVILDNASTDDTAAILDAAPMGRAPRIVHRNARTLNLSENWSRAMALAAEEAPLVRFLCADDLMTPDAVSRAVALMESDPEIALVGSLHAHSTGPVIGIGLPSDQTMFDGAAIARAYLMRRHGAISSTHFLIRSAVAQAVAPMYRADPYIAFQDVEGAMRAMAGRKYGFVHAPLGWTRMHDETETSAGKRQERYLRDWLILLDRIGPLFLDARELARTRAAHLRQFHRRLLLWSVDGHPREVVEANAAFLAARGEAPGFGDYALALVEWCALAMIGRRDLVGAPDALERVGAPPPHRLYPFNAAPAPPGAAA